MIALALWIFVSFTIGTLWAAWAEGKRRATIRVPPSSAPTPISGADIVKAARERGYVGKALNGQRTYEPRVLS